MSQIAGLFVNAKSMNMKGDLIELDGDVQMVFDGQNLTSQRATYHRKSKVVTAFGDVNIDTPTLHIEGSRVELETTTKKAKVFDGLVRSGQISFDGEIIYKTGDNEYEVINGNYTACTSCPPTWSISAKKIHAQFGGYANLSNSFFRVGGLPIIWLPGLLIPLKSERQSGLLPPTLGASTENGAIFTESYFWAISRSQDATFSIVNYERRGAKILGNYRYVLSPRSYGEWNVGRLFQDRVFGKDLTFNTFRSVEEQDQPVDRWFTTYSHYYDLPNDFVQRTQLNLVGDLRYVRDFTEDIRGHGNSSLENRISLTQNKEFRHFSIDTAHYQNLIKANPSDGNADAVHRFPEVRYSVVERPLNLGNLTFRIDTKYTNFARSGFSYDDVDDPSVNPALSGRAPSSKRDGKFDPNIDLIRAGQRFEFVPNVSYPLKWGRYIDVLPEFSFHESDYFFGLENQPSIRRGYARANVSMRTKINGFWNDSDPNPEATRFKHEIVPEITSTSIPYLDQTPSSLSFFDPEGTIARRNRPLNDNDFLTRRIQFDYDDRIYDRNSITLSLTNKLIRKRWTSGKAKYDQIARFLIYQSYDIYEIYRSDNPKPLSDLTSVLELNLDHIDLGFQLDYHPYHNITDTTSSLVRLKSSHGYVQTEYTYTNVVSDDTTDVPYQRRSESLAFGLGTSQTYFILGGKITLNAKPEGGYNFDVVKWNYDLTLLLPGNCWAILWSHSHDVGADTKVFLSFEFKFDGKTSKSLSSK